eukprot:4557243-Pyramimonas_sp.AAC.1
MPRQRKHPQGLPKKAQRRQQSFDSYGTKCFFPPIQGVKCSPTIFPSTAHCVNGVCCASSASEAALRLRQPVFYPSLL